MRSVQTLRYMTRCKSARSLYYGIATHRSLSNITLKDTQQVTRQKAGPPSFIWQRSFRVSSLLNSDTIVKVPPFAESVSEGDIRWEKQVGDSVSEDEVVAEIETDKTAVPVLAPCAGVITELLIEDGEKVVAGQEILKMQEGAAPATPPPPKAEATPSPAAEPAAAPAQPATPPPPPAAEPTVTGAQQIRPPADLSALKLPQAGAKAAAASAAAPKPATPGVRGEQRIKINRMRQRIAQRLKDAQNTCAMLTTFNEVDMSNLFEMRTLYKDGFAKEHGAKLGFMSAFVKGAAYALKKMPVVNAVIDGNEIVYRDYVDVSIAVATPKGLVVPVIRNAETMNYADIEKTIHALGEKAKAGSLAIEDMDGGTFTISNGGVFGSLMGTPIINPPQSAILGMHGVFDRPVARNGQVVIKPMMYVALTYDHRLIDGREAVSFLRKVKNFVEDPRILLLDL